jgi:hypothetical protein
MDQELDIEVSKCDGYCRITLSGAFMAEQAGENHRKISRLVYATGLDRFLVDVRGVQSRCSIPDIFEYAVQHYPPRPGSRRTATVDLPENLVTARFFEHLMQNKGQCYRLFMDEAEAITWLLSDEP